jgi:hypothetical protein
MKTKNKKNFNFLNDLILPVLLFFATLPFMMFLGLFESAGQSCNHMAHWYAKDYIQKNW